MDPGHKSNVCKTFKRRPERLLNVLYNNAQKMKFSIKISSVNVTNSQFPADLVTFTGEMLNGKLHFCAV